MRVVWWWDSGSGWLRLHRWGDLLLVHEEPGTRARGSRARSFDLGSGRPLGPSFSTGELVCLAELPGQGPGPVLARPGPGTLVLSDPRDGVERARIALPALEGVHGLEDMSIARVRGRDLLFLYGEYEPAGFEWRTVPLDGTEPDPELSDSFALHGSARERLAMNEEYLVVPGEELEFYAEDATEAPRSRLYRVDDGAFLGQCDSFGSAEAVVATVAGRAYLGQGSQVYALPGLEPLPYDCVPVGRTVRALVEWEGRPVAILSHQCVDVPCEPGKPWPVRLCFRYLDERSFGDDASPAEFLWEVPGELYDLLAVDDHRVAVATSAGVYVLDVRGAGSQVSAFF